MTIPNFIDYSPETPITASWLNQVSNLNWGVMGGDSQAIPTTVAQLLANLGIPSLIQGGSTQWLTSVSGTDTITAVGNPTVASYSAGQVFRFVAVGTNTTNAPTLNVDGIGAVNLVQLGGSSILPGSILSGYVVTAVYDGAQFQAIFPTATKDIQTVSASVASNALTVGYTAIGALQFRNGSLPNGALSKVGLASPLSLTVPSGATLGTASGTAATLMLLVAYNGGAPVLCIANLSGGLDFSETGLISPTTISGSSNSASTVYSESAVSANSPYRVVGYVTIMEATAGTWATSPTLVQGIGGLAGITSIVAASTAAANAPINNTGAVSDVPLALGQEAYIDIAAASSVPLHIATADLQQYEIRFMLNGASGASNGNVLLLPNNGSITNMFFGQVLDGVNTAAQASSGFFNGFLASFGDVAQGVINVITRTAAKTILGASGSYISASGFYLYHTFSRWLGTASSSTTTDTTTAWTSLGTLAFSNASTGRIIIRRIA